MDSSQLIINSQDLVLQTPNGNHNIGVNSIVLRIESYQILWTSAKQHAWSKCEFTIQELKHILQKGSTQGPQINIWKYR